MNIAILKKEFDELKNNSALFDSHNFRARKEALNFVRVIGRFSPEANIELARLQEQARSFADELRTFNTSLAQTFFARFKAERPTPDKFRTWLEPYTDYSTQQWGQPHYGYENLDFLLDEVLLPQPHPQPCLPPTYGMVRYEPTPASVILELTERINFSGKDVFYDLGSGLGKVTMLIQLLTDVRCVGVEYQPAFCAYAANQAHRLSFKNLGYHNLDARDVDYSNGTVFFLFNPFGGSIFDTVLEKLRLESQERAIQICSYGSASQPLSELPWLKPIQPYSEHELSLSVFQRRG